MLPPMLLLKIDTIHTDNIVPITTVKTDETKARICHRKYVTVSIDGQAIAVCRN